MEQKINNGEYRNLTGSLEQCKEELRDAYMSFKDLQTRCIVDLKRNTSSSEEHPVYYFKPETFLLDDPEKQRQYRQDLLKKIGSIPKPDPITYLGDELHRSMCQIVADRSTPKATKALLAEFFKRRQYNLQHMKYKLLCRWAHHNLTSETAENIGSEATFIYGKLEYNLEQSILRNERLEQEDFYDKAVPENRPSTKSTMPGGSSLYVEKFDLLPQSLIREDDIEVYMRGVAHRNKLTKVVNKFISRLKWLPLNNKYQIFENAITEYFDLKNRNIEKQLKLHDQVIERAQKTLILNHEMKTELDQLVGNYYCKLHEKTFISQNDKTIHFWKANHDEVPQLIGDPFSLKIKILDFASKFNLLGDIELDNGFSFSYQVTVFFPTYFQRQVLKSQFSIYDSHDDDPNKIKKRTLNSMARIDTNIFRDVSTTKHTVPSDEAIQFEFKDIDIKIMRLKSAAYWIDYVILTPTEPDWHQKQQSLLSNENPVDTLLKQGFNFLDVNDLATINRINEDNTQLHLNNVRKIKNFNPHNQMAAKAVSTSDGDKFVNIDKMPLKASNNLGGNIEAHLMNSVQDLKEEDSDSGQNTQSQPKSSLPSIQSHLLTSYYTLRFMKSRDSKTRIMYTLNYFRSIQKRLALDLREFASRDRIDSHFVNPFIQSKEANQLIINQANYSAKAFEKIHKNQVHEAVILGKKMTVFDVAAINSMNNMASLRQYKHNGLFNNRIFSTCPSYPKYHASNGEPIVTQPVSEEQDRSSGNNITEGSLKLMGRIEFVEMNEELQEVYIKDDFGIYILYDCVLQDMKWLEDELCKIGSYFLNKSEILLDPSQTYQGNRAFPSRDRLELIHDLLEKECEFQFNKVKLCQVYMECYEHITDPLEQQKLMQIITDIMARRPRLNLNATYFVDAYDTEIICLQKQFQLVKMLVDLQITLEKTENKRLQDSLNLSYYLANQYSQNKWKYQDHEELLKCIDRKRKLKKNSFPTSQVIDEEKVSAKESSTDSFTKRLAAEANEAAKALGIQDDNSQHLDSNSAEVPKNGGVWHEEETELSDDDEEFLKDEQNKFSKLLGLPQISLESIYQTYHEKDINILKIMGEHAHFISLHEGYPEFLTRLTHRSILDKNRLFKPNHWSQETGSLDFYETLDFITKYYAVTLQMHQELYDGLQMWDSTLMTQIDIQVAELSMKELRHIISIQDGSVVEYQGRDLVEDEQVMGSSDKMIFYAKEMLADLTCKDKKLLCPFIMAKLDLQTIKFFEFPKIPTLINKYTQRKKGIAGIEQLLASEKLAIEGIAKSKVEQNDVAQLVQGLIGGQVGDAMNLRNIVVPSQLKTYCNMMELHRLRSELILAATETQMLSQIYLGQCEIVGQKNPKLCSSEGISFELNEQEIKFVNFVDHGPSHMNIIDLAAREFDPTLLSNMNFRNPDAFKINILTSGLEEIRAVLQYQILQKHILIVALRMNSLLIDSHQRAFSELNLIQMKKIAIPNSIIRYQKLMNRHSDTLNYNNMKSERAQYKLSLSSNCLPVFYNVISKKSSQRTNISKEFSQYQTTVMQSFAHTEYPVLRLMRNYKLKLLTRFVQQTLTEVYLDAQKVQALQSCQRLRVFNRYFNFDPKQLGMSDDVQDVFKYETSPLIENFPSNYMPEQFIQDDNSSSVGAKKFQDLKVINIGNYEILDYSGIPSSTTLLSMESTPIEDLRTFKQKRFDIRSKVWGDEGERDDLKYFNQEITEPEIHLKRLLPTFTPDENFEQNLIGKKSVEEIDQSIKKKIGCSAGSLLDYEEALYFGDSKYASLTRYYVQLERISTIEWFLQKLQLRSEEAIHIDNAMECGLPFWKEDEFDARIQGEMNVAPKDAKVTNKRAYEFFFDQVVSFRQKKNIAEVVQSLGLTLKSFICQYKKTREEQRFDYLSQYTEFRFQQVIGSLHKLVQQFYYQKNINAVQTIRASIARITKMGHVKVAYMQPNNYSVNTCVVSPLNYCLESGNLIYGSVQYDDIINFKRCIHPVINEKALEPPQVTLFQSLYQQDYLRRSFPSQFAGQFSSWQNSVPFKAFDLALLQLTSKERVYCQSFISQAKNQANDFMETVFNDKTMANLTKEEVYNMAQLTDAKKFINETTQALLLRNGLICWFENSSLPDSTETYEKFESNFRQNFFWKQLQQKEELTKKHQQANTYGQIPTQAQLKELKMRIDNMANDQSLATQGEMAIRDNIVKALREEFAILKKKVTLDNYFNMKAEIYVFSNEIEKFMIRASVKTLDSECLALAKCFSLQVPKIQYHIHPFQQFAATFFDQCDPNMHLDVCNRVTAVQVLLTKMRNRSTEVETLTSGPGMVFTIKDINDILQEFCRSTIKDQEKQFKSRSETAFLIEDNLRNLLYFKDQHIKTLEQRLRNIGVNLENIIDARLFEKGNQLIYELDSSNRVLSLFKNAMSGLERRLLEKILDEQMQKFKRQNNKIELKDQKFNQYKDTIYKSITADWAEDAEKIKTLLKNKADMAKITDKSLKSIQQIPQMYPLYGGAPASTNQNKIGQTNSDELNVVLNLLGAMVPKGFEHYSTCSCYVPNPNHPRPTLELAEYEMLSEKEARQELSKVCTLIRKQRILYRTKEMCMMTKFNGQISLLKKQLNSNVTLWDQLGESEKRERVLRQELLYTQQSLSASEKIILGLKDEIKNIDAERVRLLNFKTNKVGYLKELEVKVNKMDLFENIDTDKLLLSLVSKDAALSETKTAQQMQQLVFEAHEKQRSSEVAKLKSNFRNEQIKTQAVVDKMDQMKIEIKSLEANDNSAAGIWKKKCYELYEVCQTMKYENEELRDRCKELINQGIELAEAVSKSDHNNKLQISSLQILPRLGGSDSQLKMNKYISQTSKETRAMIYSTNNTLQNTFNLKRSNDPSQLSDNFIKAKGLASEVIIPNDQQISWGVSTFDQVSSNKKETQLRNRTVVAPLDYTHSVNYGTQKQNNKTRPANDIKAILSGVQDKITSNRKRFGSTDKSFISSINQIQPSLTSSQTKRRQNQPVTAINDSIFNTSYGTSFPIGPGNQNLRQQHNSIGFDLKGTAVVPSVTIGSPKTRLLQQSRKMVTRQQKLLKKDEPNDYIEEQRGTAQAGDLDEFVKSAAETIHQPLSANQRDIGNVTSTPDNNKDLHSIQRSQDTDSIQ